MGKVSGIDRSRHDQSCVAVLGDNESLVRYWEAQQQALDKEDTPESVSFPPQNEPGAQFAGAVEVDFGVGDY